MAANAYVRDAARSVGRCALRVVQGACRPRGRTAPDGRARYRFTWAFDTQTSDDEMSMFRPAFPAEGIDTMEFGLCNKVSNMILFMSPTGSFNVFSQYVAQLLGLDPTRTTYRYIGFYIYLVNFIRLVGASPEVTLHRCPPRGRDSCGYGA